MVRGDRAQLCSTYRQIEIENDFWQTVFNNLGMSGRPIHIILTVVDSMLLFVDHPFRFATFFLSTGSLFVAPI